MANHCLSKGFCMWKRVGDICDSPDDCDEKMLYSDLEEDEFNKAKE